MVGTFLLLFWILGRYHIFSAKGALIQNSGYTIQISGSGSGFIYDEDYWPGGGDPVITLIE